MSCESSIKHIMVLMMSEWLNYLTLQRGFETKLALPMVYLGCQDMTSTQGFVLL